MHAPIHYRRDTYVIPTLDFGLSWGSNSADPAAVLAHDLGQLYERFRVPKPRIRQFQLLFFVALWLMTMFASFAVYLRYRDDAFFVAVCPPEIRRLLQNSQVNRGTLYALCIAVKWAAGLYPDYVLSTFQMSDAPKFSWQPVQRSTDGHGHGKDQK